MPPTSIDGNEITGATIDGQDVSEITVDGDVVFTSAPGPDSVAYLYRAEDFASPWPDTVGSADMTVNGLVSSTFSNGEDSVFGDGDDGDYGTASGPEQIPTNESFGVAFSTEYIALDRTTWFGTQTIDSSPIFEVTDIDFISGLIGRIVFRLADDNGNEISVHTNNTFDDGNAHLVVINKTGNTASDIDIYVDDMSAPVQTGVASDAAFDHTAYTPPADMAFWALNNQGSISGRKKLQHAGFYEFNTQPYNESERNNLLSRRPEV